MMYNLSKIPNWQIIGPEGIINYMLDNGITTITNDYGFGTEYEIDDIEESFVYFVLTAELKV
jgi:hypothetical protein